MSAEANEGSHDALVNLALAFYIGEPCRICGKPITKEDIDNGAVFAGYNEDNTSRSAHKECWEAQEKGAE